MTINRRDLLKWSLVAPALAAGSQAAFARMPQGLDALLLDERFSPRSLAGQPLPQHAELPVMRFAGDVTKIWYDTIDQAWRGRGYVLGGITGSDALFVLETLANHHGRRVVSRTALNAPLVHGIAPISWVIAPVHSSVIA